MTELILLDRMTGLNVSVGFSDGVLTIDDSVGVAVSEPVIADQISGKYWKLFIYNKVIGYEETSETSTEFIEITDSENNINWRFQVLDGVLGYIHIIGVSASVESIITEQATLESIVTEDSGDFSTISAFESVDVPCGGDENLESIQTPDVNTDSLSGGDVGLDSKHSDLNAESLGGQDSSLDGSHVTNNQQDSRFEDSATSESGQSRTANLESRVGL